jgi:two-component system, OmpR family, sensor kinase
VSLRARLAWVAAGLTLLGAAIGLVVTYVGLLNLRITTLDDDNRLLASLITEVVVMREDQTVRVPGVVSTYLTGERSGSAAQVYVDGQLIWSGGVTAAPRPLDAERLLLGIGGQTVNDWRVYTLRDEDAGVVVQVGRPLLGLREVLGPYPALGVAVVLLVTALTGALAWWIVGLALRPLRRLTEAAERFTSEDDVPPIPGRDEPARLARAFAELLRHLRAERDRERRFLAYAAHELRTPLSALRAGLEGATSGRLTAGPELLARLHREATRLENLAQNLLALSTAQAGETELETVDLAHVAGEAYDRFLPLALEKGLTLDLDASAAEVNGNARLLDQALSNLVSNALRATSRGGVVIRTGADAGRAFIEVEDTGSGFKAPPPDGKGLGLRVVRAVADAHGGTLEFDGSNGTRARLWLSPGATDGP